MKRYLIGLIMMGGVTMAAHAQKSQIRAAENYLGERNLERAKSAIDAAALDASTKDNPRTWYVRGVVYLNLSQPGSEAHQYYKEAASSFKKTVALDPGYEKKDMDNRIYSTAIHFFNSGITLFKGQAYKESAEHFGEVISLNQIGDGKRFASMKSFDTITRQASLYKGYSLYHDNKYEEAFPFLLQAKTDPIVTNPTIYLQLCDIYEERNDQAGLAAVIQEGRKAFPLDKSLLSRELNYYIKAGRSEELITKLESAIVSDPGNAQLVYILAQTYESMANPRDRDGKELPQPANHEALFKKASEAFDKAMQLAPEEPAYPYGIGALYFNKGVLLTQQMNAIPGTSAAEIKKYDALKKEREDWFSKALPYLDQTIRILKPKAGSLSGEDRATYIDAIRAAQEIYARQNNQEKANEMKALFDALH